MLGFETDRTLSTQEWRRLLLAGCGVLVLGLGCGVLIGRLTATADPPPVSASILPDYDAAPATESAPAQSVVAAPAAPPPTVVAPPAPSAPPVVQQAAAPAPERVVAGAPPVVSHKPAPSAAPESAVKHPAKPAAVEAPPPAKGPRWVVQLGAFQSSEHANLLVNTLAVHGQPARVRFANGWFYVQTPPYRTAAAAKGAAQTLAAREHVPTYLIKLPAGAD